MKTETSFRFKSMGRSAVLIVVLALSAEGNGFAAEGRSHARASLSGRVYTLKLGQTVVLAHERLKINFTSVVSDSRCPTGVTCVWEGDAEVQLAVSRATDTASTLQLHTNQRFAQAEQYQGYVITLLRLAPYPKSGAKPRLHDYVVGLSVKPE